MVDGFISGLFLALVLSVFNVDEMFIKVVQPFVPQAVLTADHFFVAFAIIGLVGGAFKHK